MMAKVSGEIEIYLDCMQDTIFSAVPRSGSSASLRSPSTSLMKFTIVVRFSNSDSRQPPIRDLLVPLLVNPETENVNRLVTVSWLRNTIRDQVPAVANRRLRLIVDGRVLVRGGTLTHVDPALIANEAGASVRALAQRAQASHARA